MTARTLYSYGLLAGMTLTELRHTHPGFVLDMYKWHMQYDDQQHGIKREKGGLF